MAMGWDSSGLVGGLEIEKRVENDRRDGIGASPSLMALRDLRLLHSQVIPGLLRVESIRSGEAPTPRADTGVISSKKQ